MRQYILSFPLLIAVAALAACHGKNAGGSDPDLGSSDAGAGEIPGLLAITVSPATTTLELDGATAKTQAFTATGSFADGKTKDITDQVTFHLAVAELGSFTGATLKTTVDRAGTTKVIATAGSKTGSADLVIVLRLKYSDPTSTGLPADPSSLFTGNVDAARAPKLVYPNDGVLVPPNLGKLEIHFLKGSSDNQLYELSFQSAVVDLKVYSNCPTALNGGCIYLPDGKVWRWIAENNRGSEITVKVRATGTAGGTVGESMPLKIDFSQDDLTGALYYWTADDNSANTKIVRWDFSSLTQAAPELVVTPKLTGDHCVGCHSLSPDGTRLFVAAEGSYDAFVLLLNVENLMPLVPFDSTPNSAFASWKADGTQYVGAFADDTQTPDGRWKSYDLNLFDGATAAYVSSITVGGTKAHPVTHPDWAASGDLIAFTRITGTAKDNGSIVYGARSQVEIIKQSGNAWSQPIALTTAAKGQGTYYPAFSPDSKSLVFCKSLCGDGDDGDDCDMYDDPGAQLFLIAPEAGALPVSLARANAPGATDTATFVENSFAKWAPFIFQRTGEFGSRLEWLTFSSNRNYGLRKPGDGKTLVWMAGVDPDGNVDPSYPAFALPFQDLATDNHTPQWAKEAIPIVQ